TILLLTRAQRARLWLRGVDWGEVITLAMLAALLLWAGVRAALPDIGAWLAPQPQLIYIVPTAALPTAPPATLADGLRVVQPGALTFPVVQRHVADILTVSEDEIAEAMRFALLRLKLVIEPSGAVPLAAVLARRMPAGLQRVGIILSGGDIDPPVLAGLWPAVDAAAASPV
ncbi:hypothetical protein SE17_25190, partial [Kouleothrix aurantiaca]